MCVCVFDIGYKCLAIAIQSVTFVTLWARRYFVFLRLKIGHYICITSKPIEKIEYAYRRNACALWLVGQSECN